MPEPTTLRALSGLPSTPATLADSTLVMIDCQNTYVDGVMALDGVAAALDDAAALLGRARSAGIPIVVSPAAVQAASLAALGDLFAIVVPDVAAIPD